MEQVLHISVFQLKDCESDRAYTRANKLLLRIVERRGCQEQWESLQSVIKEKVYCLIVEPKNHGFQKVDKVVRELVVLGKLEFIGDQV